MIGWESFSLPQGHTGWDGQSGSSNTATGLTDTNGWLYLNAWNQNHHNAWGSFAQEGNSVQATGKTSFQGDSQLWAAAHATPLNNRVTASDTISGSTQGNIKLTDQSTGFSKTTPTHTSAGTLNIAQATFPPGNSGATTTGQATLTSTEALNLNNPATSQQNQISQSKTQTFQPFAWTPSQASAQTQFSDMKVYKTADGKTHLLYSGQENGATSGQFSLSGDYGQDGNGTWLGTVNGDAVHADDNGEAEWSANGLAGTVVNPSIPVTNQSSGYNDFLENVWSGAVNSLNQFMANSSISS